MNYLQEFEKWQKSIEAVKIEDVILPNIPIDVMCGESEALQEEATKDKDALVAAGLDWPLVAGLGSLSHALRYCQAQWMSEYKAIQANQQEWNEVSPVAYDLRDELLHHFTYAYRKDENVLTKVGRIRQGAGHTDMIQDLLELSVLAEKYPEPLTQINFNTDLTAKATATSSQLGLLLAKMNGDAGDASLTKMMRDKAFTLLMNRVSVIRECGRYVFWRTEERREKYACDYRRN